MEIFGRPIVEASEEEAKNFTGGSIKVLPLGGEPSFTLTMDMMFINCPIFMLIPSSDVKGKFTVISLHDKQADEDLLKDLVAKKLELSPNYRSDREDEN